MPKKFKVHVPLRQWWREVCKGTEARAGEKRKPRGHTPKRKSRNPPYRPYVRPESERAPWLKRDGEDICGWEVERNGVLLLATPIVNTKADDAERRSRLERYAELAARELPLRVSLRA